MTGPSDQEIDAVGNALGEWFLSQELDIRMVLVVCGYHFAELLSTLQSELKADDVQFETALDIGLKMIAVRARQIWKMAQLMEGEERDGS